MTWPDAKAALQLLAEEQVGYRVRAHEAQEDAQYQRSVTALRKERPRAR